MMAVTQGYIVHTALIGPMEPAAYLEGVRALDGGE